MNRASLLFFALLALATLSRADTPVALTIPRPDRAEVMSVAPGETDGPKAELSAAKARKILKLLQAFKWDGPAGACDKLQYIIRFYAKDKLVATDGICFHCGCLVALDADNHASGEALSFDLGNAHAKYLEAYLANFFPATK
jgi:Rieske Fe-S protein